MNGRVTTQSWSKVCNPYRPTIGRHLQKRRLGTACSVTLSLNPAKLLGRVLGSPVCTSSAGPIHPVPRGWRIQLTVHTGQAGPARQPVRPSSPPTPLYPSRRLISFADVFVALCMTALLRNKTAASPSASSSLQNSCEYYVQSPR